MPARGGAERTESHRVAQAGHRHGHAAGLYSRTSRRHQYRALAPRARPIETRAAILLNKEVIAIDQDPLGQQGRRVRDDGDLEVWSRPLADGGRAVILFNRGTAPAEIAVDWAEIGYPRTIAAEVRDLWAHKSLGRMKGRFAAKVEPHAVVMVRVTP